VKKRRFYGQKPTLWPKIFAKNGHDILRSYVENMQFGQKPTFFLKLIKKLKQAMTELTPTQKRTVYKLFVKNMTQAEIAKEEGLSKAAITYRVNGIYSRLKKLLEKK